MPSCFEFFGRNHVDVGICAALPHREEHGGRERNHIERRGTSADRGTSLQKSLSAALVNQSNSAAGAIELCRSNGGVVDSTSSTTSLKASGQGHAAHGPVKKKRTDVGCQTNSELEEHGEQKCDTVQCESCAVQKRQFEEEKSGLLEDLERMTEKCRGMVTTNQPLWNTLLTSKHVQDINIGVDQLDGTVRSYMNLVTNMVK